MAAALWTYGPALGGDFFSDDLHYVEDNPYVQDFGLASWREIWNPLGVLPRMTENYEPVHLALHALAWQAFGADVRGHHVVNVVFHALAGVALIAIFLRSGVGRAAAVAAGAVFLLHPANVEAVAWIAQLKSSSALLLSLLAILAEPRRPWLGALLFALALLAKPSALYALPVVVAFAALEPGGSSARWRGLALWALAFGAFVLVELPAFFATAGSLAPLYDDPGVRLRSSVVIGLRYLAMAATGRGLSMFHEPEPVLSWLDPAWLLGLAVLGAMVWRFVHVLRARRLEVVFWVWAAAAFAPSSGVLALPYPLADRYLYAVLPGLLGVVLLLGGDALRWLEERAAAQGVSLGGETARRVVGPSLGLAVALLFAVQAHGRAALWRSPALLMADAVRNYPEGTAARLSEAVNAARGGDAEGAARALRAAHARGWNRLDQVLAEPAYAPLRDAPAFRAVIDEIAREHLRRLARVEDPGQLDFQAMAVAHYARGDLEATREALERGLEAGGPLDDRIRADLERVRDEARRAGR